MRIIAKGSISFSGVKDVRGSVKRLEVGSALGIVELLQISSLCSVAARARPMAGERTEEADTLESYFAPWSL